MKWCFCASNNNNSIGQLNQAQDEQISSAPITAPQTVPADPQNPMLARIINELAGLPIDTETEGSSDEEFVDSRENASPRRGSTTVDAAHLTPASSSMAGISSQDSYPQSDRRSRWSSFMDNAKRVIDNIIDIVDSDSESPAPRPRRERPSPPGATTAGFPTTARDSTSNSEVDLSLLGDTTPPTPLRAPDDQPLPDLSQPSALMEEHHIRGLVAEVPLRYRQSSWKLIYSTLRDGISMQTMMRNARGKSPTILVVRDMGKALFGAFCSEPWKLSTRYYGTGETFVFQLSPKEVVWHWWYKKASVQQNDYFMWGTQDEVAVGGAGGYAMRLDSELARGVSRNSITFGNDSLSSQEEFRIGAVELWWLE